MGAFLLGALALLKGAEGISKIKEGKSAERQAKIQGEIKATERAKKAKKLLGVQTMQFLKSGVGLGKTPQIIFEETLQFAKEDIGAIRDFYRNVGKDAKRKATFSGLTDIAMSGFIGAKAFAPQKALFVGEKPSILGDRFKGFDAEFDIDTENLMFNNFGRL